MRERRINKEYLNTYGQVILTQPLAHGTVMKQVYTKDGNRWQLSYESNSAYHICPFDGVFRNCRDCGALEEDFDIEFCRKKQSYISTGALIERINDCKKAGLNVQLIDQVNEMGEVNNRDCYWYYWEDEENPCCLEDNEKRKPCYLHVPCYYYVALGDTDNYIRKLIRQVEELKLIRVELP